jgi:plasmid replication initiation protein
MNDNLFYFSANLNYAECEELYRQHIKFIIVTERGGKRIRLPKHNMQKFITPIGIVGSFVMQVDRNNKILSIKKLD